ncbi:stage II sporulation protein D [Cytobacillus spongiae]|uniref:stage II sporulation protein D n=1 Tax=Cytobacillus spongiae TaxID=2901381 RepID=UPI001F15CF32|nr:stage II sporulation protein D [Cytobacillus spongiae]UII55721.1 stage II sporulation protein D [Cytobacillus spongiae]
MFKFKPIVALVSVLFVVTLMVPTLLVLPFTDSTASGKLGEELNKKKEPEAVQTASAGPAVEVAVYRTAKQQLEKPELEEYLVGVVASEMPAEFEKEALKAQALTARTYIVRQMLSSERVGLPDGALVTDTETHQVYKNDEELRKQWGVDYNWKIAKIREAVAETAGQILTFNGEPITATFFSTSNGYTENSEAVWPNAFPYLRSVESPWDLKSPKYDGQVVMSVTDFQAKLGVKVGSEPSVGKIREKTKSNRVGKVEIGGKSFTGIEIREKLELKSTDFTWERKGNNIVIQTKGYGHGVGLSQYGANGMAAEGKTYQEIVQHYYNGIEIASSQSFLTKITAKK